MNQTLALLLDAYRDLNARKMFWIVLILSALVAASFGALGLKPDGYSIFTWHISSAQLNAREISPADFFKFVFLRFGIDFWLSWLATVLALISTACLFPDFLSSGAVDLYLSKPIGRLRLFLTKYLCGLLFVALQILCFCAACFLVIGLRGGAWEPGIFIAVPIVVLFFSYLFCVCALIGVWSRSTVAAVLLTFLFWVTIFGVNATEVGLLTLKIRDQDTAASLDREIAATQGLLAAYQHAAATRPTERNREYVKMYQDDLKVDKSRRSEIQGAFNRPHQMFYDVETILPKTSETISLLDRVLISRAGLQRVSQSSQDQSRNTGMDNDGPMPVAKVSEEILSRSVTWVVGTSVAFEVVVLALGAWIFCRRDY